MRHLQLCKLSTQKGLSLIEVIIGAAAIAITAVALPSVMKLVQHNSTQSQAARVATTERAKIEAYLKNRAAWTQTLAKNSSFTCGTSATGCSPNASNNGFYPFVLYSEQANEKVTYDPADPTSRVTLQGHRCPGGIADPSERCPIKYQAEWKPLCGTYPCVNPSLQIRVTLSTVYGTGGGDVIPINSGRYSYAVVRSFNEDDVQSACFILGGTYNSVTNTCIPPHAGRSCIGLGRPAQVITGIDPDGSIDCAPFYTGTCNPATQMMIGISALGAAICGPKPPPIPVVDCVGSWGACSAACNGGTQTFSITTPASGGGAACPFANGASRACNTGACPVNCVGSWQACTQPCGGGTSTFIVTTPAANGGSACIANHGDVVACNTQACGVAVDCAGTWSACNPGTGTQTFTITQTPQNGGAACPASPRNCAVDCVGDWGACTAGSRTYSWSVTPKNGGAACPYADGATDTCSVPPFTPTANDCTVQYQLPLATPFPWYASQRVTVANPSDWTVTWQWARGTGTAEEPFWPTNCSTTPPGMPYSCRFPVCGGGSPPTAFLLRANLRFNPTGEMHTQQWQCGCENRGY